MDFVFGYFIFSILCYIVVLKTNGKTKQAT